MARATAGTTNSAPRRTTAPQAPGVPKFLKVYQKDPKTGKYTIVSMATSKMTPADLDKAISSPLNQSVGNARGGSDPTPYGDNPTPIGPSAQTIATAPPAEVAPPPAPVWDPSRAYETDPWYRKQKGELDYERSQMKGEYDSLMGVDGAKGKIWQNWQHALDQLTRGSRDNISSTNAGLSGANLAGSGVARKSLSDIAASFFSEQGNLNTQRSREESDAQRDWTDYQTRYAVSDSSLLDQAAERWRVNNQGLTPLGEEPPVAPVAPAPSPNAPVAPTNNIGLGTPPKGATNVVKKGSTISYTTKTGGGGSGGGGTSNVRVTRPSTGVGTVKAGTPAPVATQAKTFTDKQGNLRRVGTGTIIRKAR